jgi:hypothetical protein
MVNKDVTSPIACRKLFSGCAFYVAGAPALVSATPCDRIWVNLRTSLTIFRYWNKRGKSGTLTEVARGQGQLHEHSTSTAPGVASQFSNPKSTESRMARLNGQADIGANCTPRRPIRLTQVCPQLPRANRDNRRDQSTADRRLRQQIQCSRAPSSQCGQQKADFARANGKFRRSGGQ